MKVLQAASSGVALVLIFAFGGATQTESNSGHVYYSGNWAQLEGTPGPITSTALAYSPDDDIILLYGGRNQGVLQNVLWVYNIDSDTWTQKEGWACSPCPSPRSVHSMVYDQHSHKFIVFGGYLVSGHSFETNETWTYDFATNSWQLLNFTSPIPGKRHWGALEYNPEDNMTYLFGGHYNKGPCPGDIMYNDVWRLDIRGPAPKWTNMAPQGDPTYGIPEPRQSDWVYNTIDKKLYVFGGKKDLGPPLDSECDSGAKDIETFYNDIWRYDPAQNRWSRIQATQTDYTHFPKERRTDMVYDELNNRVIFFGELPVPTVHYLKDTWIYDFDDGKWSTLQDVDNKLPEVRVRFAAAWDPVRNSMYIYGTDASFANVNFWKLTVHPSPVSVDCFGKQPIIFGTAADDQFNGTTTQDVMLGIEGNDVIRGGKGFDFICGHKGNDFLYGDVGNDKLFGFDGNDQLYGGGGNDRLVGGAGDDKLSGNLGADFFDCGRGIDSITDFNASQGDSKTSDCEN